LVASETPWRSERLPVRSATLNARRVAEEAEEEVLSLPEAHEESFGSFLPYVVTDEPAIHLMPLHFLPEQSRGTVAHDSLHQLGVAAKLEYARNRWLDEMVDDSGPSALPLSAHRLNDALLDLINSRYARVLHGPAARMFFATLATLHARHGLSMILDGARPEHSAPRISLEEYVEHAEARHGPVRAPVDAVLLLVGAPEDELRRARLSWHRWALGVQFYDDALDVEEDLRNRSPSWAVSRTLEHLGGGEKERLAGRLPDPDLFYETALKEGVVSEALAHAESFFAESARLAEPSFPSWAAFQRECLSQTSELRVDYEELVAEARRA
jgi:hypothetical protein